MVSTDGLVEDLRTHQRYQRYNRGQGCRNDFFQGGGGVVQKSIKVSAKKKCH